MFFRIAIDPRECEHIPMAKLKQILETIHFDPEKHRFHQKYNGVFEAYGSRAFIVYEFEDGVLNIKKARYQK